MVIHPRICIRVHGFTILCVCVGGATGAVSRREVIHLTRNDDDCLVLQTMEFAGCHWPMQCWVGAAIGWIPVENASLLVADGNTFLILMMQENAHDEGVERLVVF